VSFVQRIIFCWSAPAHERRGFVVQRSVCSVSEQNAGGGRLAINRLTLALAAQREAHFIGQAILPGHTNHSAPSVLDGRNTRESISGVWGHCRTVVALPGAPLRRR